ncbi:chloramphenicol phosphotransferase CPT family protein [Actinopolymorpha alba]|uniref:chloramphenicol phosphotransferase CPT family protein n=1 Tax=Actinopolymorpha alba TaxID=533267 RepID=UPI00039F9CAE|nr:AAA family ATPase [Actinopolymorpha alba]
MNGTSSSGKSSIAQDLLPILGGPYFYMPVDAIDTMLTWTDYKPDELPAVLRQALMGFHRAVAGMAAAGNNVVVDDVLSDPWRLMDCLALFSPKDVVLVGVRCPLEELERRERARSDRSTGLAASQLERVHAHGVYDIEVDTSTTSPLECARQIKDFLPQRPTPTAFEQLKVKLSA